MDKASEKAREANKIGEMPMIRNATYFKHSPSLLPFKAMNNHKISYNKYDLLKYYENQLVFKLFGISSKRTHSDRDCI